MLIEYIEHIRAQPLEARRRFALYVSTVVTALVVVVWLGLMFAGAWAQRDPEERGEAQPESEPTTQERFQSANSFLQQGLAEPMGNSTEAPTTPSFRSGFGADFPSDDELFGDEEVVETDIQGTENDPESDASQVPEPLPQEVQPQAEDLEEESLVPLAPTDA